MGLLEAAQQMPPTSREDTMQPNDTGFLAQLQNSQTQETPLDNNKETIEEKKGFGYKGLASRRIVYDHTTNDYIYEIEEPQLNTAEIKVKKELSHLFKMVSDIDTFGMLHEEKTDYLEQTIEQIIIDNDIKIRPPEEKQGIFSLGLKNNEDQEGFLTKLLPNRQTKKEDTADKPTNGLLAKAATTQPKHFKKPKQQTETKKEDKEETKENFFSKLAFLNKNTEEQLPPEEQINEDSKDKIYYHLFRDFLGYDRINILMQDDSIEDISCDGSETPIFLYHRKYEAIETNIYFDDDLELNSFLIRLCQISGKQISIYSPIVDGKLPDGSRLQATLARTVTRGSTFTIRKFKEEPLTPIDLINYNSISIDMAAYFWMTIENGASILFCGGTASGKTTALNALLLFVPANHKIISIEDTREVNIPHKNWIAGTTRKGFSTSDQDKTGKDIDMFDLIRAALRQRPRVIIVGEVRGKEAYSLFQAMSTGHTAYATVHASDIHTLIQRLENPPIALPRALLTSLDIIVFQNAVTINKKMVRRMTSVTEIIKLDSDTNQLIFMAPYTWIGKTDDRFKAGSGSKILNKIKSQNDWNDNDLQEELERRKTILQWMQTQNIHDYKEFGRIINDYNKKPDETFKKAQEALQHQQQDNPNTQETNQTLPQEEHPEDQQDTYPKEPQQEPNTPYNDSEGGL